MYAQYFYSIRSLWSLPLFKINPINTNTGVQNLLTIYYENETISEVYNALSRNLNFLSNNTKALFYNHIQEFHSALDLKMELETLTELLSLVRLLGLFPVYLVIPRQFWQKLCKITLQEAIVDCKQYSAILIEHLHLYYISNSANVDELNAKLLQNCPKLFKESDAMFARATHSLIKAQNTLVGAENFIEEAFVSYKSVLPTLNLHLACFNLLKCQAFNEIAQLCFLKAKLSGKSNSLEDTFPYEDSAFQILISTLTFLNQLKNSVPVDEAIAEFFEKYTIETAEKDVILLIVCFLPIPQQVKLKLKKYKLGLLTFPPS